MWGDIAIAFLLAFITAFVITPHTIRLAKKVGAIDMPEKRRVNNKPIPRLGGLAVISGFIVSSIYLVVAMAIENKIDLNGIEQYQFKLIGFLLGIIVLGVFCYIDDVKGLPPIVKLFAQIASAIIMVVFGVRIEETNIEFIDSILRISPIFVYILTIGWIVGITNAINLIDGLDRIVFRNNINFMHILNNNFFIKWITCNCNSINYSFSRSDTWIFTI